MTALKSANELDQQGHKISNVGAPTPASNDAARIVDVETASTADRNRANHTGTQLASTISNFDTQVRTSRLDQMAAPTADVSFNNVKITNLAEPGSAQDAATKNYVDTSFASLASGQVLKGTVRVVTLTNVTLSAPGATLDGVSMSNGDLFLAAGQTTGSENGPYVFNGAATPATRATNWDTTGEAVVGSYWIVREGTHADKFALMTNDTFTLNTTTATFVYIGTAAAADNDSSFSTNVGTGSPGPYTINHALAATDVNVVVRELAGGYLKLTNWKVTDANNISLEPDETWATNSHRVTVIKVV